MLTLQSLMYIIVLMNGEQLQFLFTIHYLDRISEC